MTTFLLVDNGSTQAPATLQLRCIAEQLSQCSGQIIYPVSLQHAECIPADALEGIKASVFVCFMREQLRQGERNFVILPLFFGNSRALTAFIPEQQVILQQEFGVFEVRLASVLYPLPNGDPRLADIVYDHIQQAAATASLPLKNIVLVDHGSPLFEVTQVRNGVTSAVQAKLDGIVLEQAAMERRAGREYDFNGVLLEDWLLKKAEKTHGKGSAIVVLLFSLPGRHAGAGGDIVTICEAVMQRYSQFKIAISPLIGEHPLLLDMLQERLETVINTTRKVNGNT